MGEEGILRKRKTFKEEDNLLKCNVKVIYTLFSFNHTTTSHFQDVGLTYVHLILFAGFVNVAVYKRRPCLRVSTVTAPATTTGKQLVSQRGKEANHMYTIYC